MFINKNAIIALLGAIALLGVSSAPALCAEGHFDAKGKLPSRHTIDSQQQQRKSLPFADKRDFEEQKKGFIAAPEYKQIMAEAGNVAWIWVVTNGCCRARISIAFIHRCSARPF